MTRCTPIIILILSIYFGIPGMRLSADIQENIDAADRVDFATAIKEWIVLAKQGDVVAQFNLGLTFQEGRIVPQDYKTAKEWYVLAAEQGNADAHFNLGVMYYNGQGVLVDDLRAYVWFDLSASAGNDAAIINRARVAKLMTPSQIDQAKKLAKECLANKYKGC